MNTGNQSVAGAFGETIQVVCPQCRQRRLVARQCKRFCDGCGYVESCEDLFFAVELPAADADRRVADTGVAV